MAKATWRARRTRRSMANLCEVLYFRHALIAFCVACHCRCQTASCGAEWFSILISGGRARRSAHRLRRIYALDAPAHELDAMPQLGLAFRLAQSIRSRSLFVVLLLSACAGEEGRVRSASIDLSRRVFRASPSHRRQAQPAARAAGYVLYVDGSQSMAGFAGCRTQPTQFDEVLDRTAVDFGLRSLVRFGTGGSARASLVPSAIDPAIHCSPFYDRAQNADGDLFEHILADTSASVHLYLTDGVQSDLTTTQSPSVTMLRRWLENGYALEILSFRSQFDGRGWSEARKRWVGNWKVDDRPFYLFVFARTSDALTRTLARLSPSVRSTAIGIRFGGSPTRCSTEPVISRADSRPSPSWMFISKPATGQLRQASTPVIRFLCSSGEDSPIASVRFILDSLQYGRWNGKEFAFPADAPLGIAITADSTANLAHGFSSIVSLRLTDDPTTRFGFLAVQMVPGQITVQPNVAALSTNSDGDVSSANKTYRMSWVIEQLARADLERALPMLPFALTVTYR